MGTYTCVARNCYGSITSSANVRILDLETEEYPRFLKRLTRTHVLVGQSGCLEVKLSGASKPKVKWFKNSMPVKENRRIEVIVQK